MSRLFISYNHRDRSSAFALRQWLIREQQWAGHEIFVDAEDLTAGVEWHPKLLAEAEGAQVMLFLASEHSLNKDSFCYEELKHAKGQILCVTLGGVTPEDPRLNSAVSHHPGAKARQITPLDVEPVEELTYDGVGRYPAGSARVNPACVASLGNTLRELGVAPNSFSWTRKDEGPFPGLRPLVEGDEAIFRGRDLEIRDGIKVLDDLRATVSGRVLLIQAPSGAGKSSFLRAGLWRRLRRHPGFTPLAIVRTQGGAVRHPDWGLVKGLFETLSWNPELGRKLTLSRGEVERGVAEDLPALLARYAAADAIAGQPPRTLLVGIDQAEEITALSGEDDQELDQLLQLALRKDPSDQTDQTDLRLVLTVRDDSIDATLDRLARAGLGREAVQVWRLHRLPPNRFDDIIRDVATAANRSGWPLQMEETLIDALAAAAGEGSAGESGDALPILALALQRLVANHRAQVTGKVTLPGTQTAKQFVENAVRDAAREAREKAGAGEDDLHRLVIPRLAAWDHRAGVKGAAKRQVCAAADLFRGDRQNLQPLAEALVEQRLLTRTGDAYEVAHEALLRVPPLGELIHARREKFEHVRILEVETQQWADAARVDSHLVRFGPRLEDARTLLEDPDFGPDLRTKQHGKPAGDAATVAEYLEACGQHEEREQRKKRRNTRRVIVGLSTLLVLALAFSVIALFAVDNALKARDEAWRTDGLAALERAKSAPEVYPDRIFHTARAIGFAGFGKEAPERRVFLAPSFWREAWLLLRDDPADHPVLVPDKVDTEAAQLAEMPAYLPFWRSASYEAPVTGIEVTDTHLRAAFADGKVRQWALGEENPEPEWGQGEVAASEKSSGVEMEGDALKIHAFGLYQTFRGHPKPVTAWNLHRPTDTMYAGLEDGSVMAWSLYPGRKVGRRDLHAFLENGWLAFDEDDQTLHGASNGQAAAFAALPSVEPAPPDSGKKRFRNAVGMEFVWVEPGEFTMGGEEDGPPHLVKLTQGYWLGAYEVTQAEWQAVMKGENPSEFPDPLAPVEKVSWENIVGTKEKAGFLKRLHAKAPLPPGLTYALPTEAQWEYACRAGTITKYAFGDDLRPDQANFGNSAIGQTIAVGRYAPNAWELYDMHGNVWEWSQDWYGYYEPAPDGKPKLDPTGPPSGSLRVYRGGSFFISPADCRSASRFGSTPSNRLYDLGVRVAAVPSSLHPEEETARE